MHKSLTSNHKPFKVTVKRHSGGPKVTSTGHMERASPAALCKWTMGAWMSFPEDLVHHAFKSGISNVPNGTEDPWEDLSDLELSEESATEDDNEARSPI